MLESTRGSWQGHPTSLGPSVISWGRACLPVVESSRKRHRFLAHGSHCSSGFLYDDSVLYVTPAPDLLTFYFKTVSFPLRDSIIHLPSPFFYFFLVLFGVRRVAQFNTCLPWPQSLLLWGASWTSSLMAPRQPYIKLLTIYFTAETFTKMSCLHLEVYYLQQLWTNLILKRTINYDSKT